MLLKEDKSILFRDGDKCSSMQVVVQEGSEVSMCNVKRECVHSTFRLRRLATKCTVTRGRVYIMPTEYSPSY